MLEKDMELLAIEFERQQLEHHQRKLAVEKHQERRNLGATLDAKARGAAGAAEDSARGAAACVEGAANLIC